MISLVCKIGTYPDIHIRVFILKLNFKSSMTTFSYDFSWYLLLYKQLSQVNRRLQYGNSQIADSRQVVRSNIKIYIFFLNKSSSIQYHMFSLSSFTNELCKNGSNVRCLDTEFSLTYTLIHTLVYCCPRMNKKNVNDQNLEMTSQSHACTELYYAFKHCDRFGFMENSFFISMLMTSYMFFFLFSLNVQRKEYVKYSKVFPLSTLFDIKIPSKWYRRIIGGLEVSSGFAMAFIPNRECSVDNLFISSYKQSLKDYLVDYR